MPRPNHFKRRFTFQMRRIDLDQIVDNDVQKFRSVTFTGQFKTRRKFLQERALKQKLNGLRPTSKKHVVSCNVS